jgi:hypothetical protein
MGMGEWVVESDLVVRLERIAEHVVDEAQKPIEGP